MLVFCKHNVWTRPWWQGYVYKASIHPCCNNQSTDFSREHQIKRNLNKIWHGRWYVSSNIVKIYCSILPALFETLSRTLNFPSFRETCFAMSESLKLSFVCYANRKQSRPLTSHITLTVHYFLLKPSLKSLEIYLEQSSLVGFMQNFPGVYRK